MYKRVFGGTGDTRAYGVKFSALIWTAIAIVACSFIAVGTTIKLGRALADMLKFETAGIFACTPVAKSWNGALSGHCTNRAARFYAYVALNFATDMLILAIPIPLINDLNIPRRQKYGLISVFLIGGL
jgi:hypothetical protein